MKHLFAVLLFASPVLAEPVCEKWSLRCDSGHRLDTCWIPEVECTKWHETPTPVAGQLTAVTQFDGRSSIRVDVNGHMIISTKSDAEALKALGLKMCEGR